MIGIAMCAPITLFVLWSGVSAIRADYGIVAFVVACAAGAVTALGLAWLADTQAERLRLRPSDRPGAPPRR